MRAITALAVKDWKLLLRQPAALFFVVAWPILTAVLFGLIFGGSGGESSKPKVAISDLDSSAESAQCQKMQDSVKHLSGEAEDFARFRGAYYFAGRKFSTAQS